MAKRISVYAGAPIERALAAAGAENVSGRLNNVCERYLAMVADELGRVEMSRGEWCAVMHANNGVAALGDVAFLPMMLWANVADSPELGEKWEIDETRLSQRLKALPRSALLAIVEAVERFWERSEMDTDAAFAEIGVRPREPADV